MGTMSFPPPPDRCPLLDDDLVAYTDGELTQARLALVEAALGTSPACRHQLAAFQETGHLLREKTPLQDDPVARAAIRAQCVAAGTRARKPVALPRPGLAVLVLLLVLAVFGERMGVERGDPAEIAPPPAVVRQVTPVALTVAVPRVRSSLGPTRLPVCAAPGFRLPIGYDARATALSHGPSYQWPVACDLRSAASYVGDRLYLRWYANPLMHSPRTTLEYAGWRQTAQRPPLWVRS